MDNDALDLTIFLSNELCQILSAAGEKARKQKHAQIDIDHVMWAILTYDEQTKQVLIDNAQYQNIVDKTQDNLKQKSSWKKRPETIPLTKEIRKSLIYSLEQSILLKEKLISPLSFFLSIANQNLVPISYADLSKSLHITQGIDLHEEKRDLPEGLIEITKLSPEQLDAYVDRPIYTDQVIRALYKESKKNILLVGNDGIGKESMKYLLAKKAQEESSIFSHARIFSIDAAKVSFIAIPTLLTQIQKELAQDSHANKYILFINNLDVGANEAMKEYSTSAQLLEGLINSEVWGIITLNYNQYQNLIKSSTNTLKESETISMEEPNEELAAQMIKAKFSKQMTVTFAEDVIPDTLTLARRFLHEKLLPESAISLLDEAISQARIDNKTTITSNDVKAILSQKTGIPLTDITAEEASDLISLEDSLKNSVIGQDDAVSAVVKTIKRSRAGLKDPKRPIGSFLFIGPSGTGKTQLAKALAKAIYKDENAMIRIDMSEYTDSHTVDRLIGAPPGYVGYEEGGQLTNKVLKKPYSLILLDEVEKANPKIFDIFLQVLDDGRLTDGQGKTVDFKNTIIIMTSNLIDEEKLSQFFRTEFLNRIDQIIHFKPLSVESGKQIVKLFIKDLASRLQEKKITLEVSDEVISQIAQSGISETYGARPLRRLVEEKIEDPIVEKIISGEIKEGETIQWTQI